MLGWGTGGDCKELGLVFPCFYCGRPQLRWRGIVHPRGHSNGGVVGLHSIGAATPSGTQLQVDSTPELVAKHCISCEQELEGHSLFLGHSPGAYRRFTEQLFNPAGAPATTLDFLIIPMWPGRVKPFPGSTASDLEGRSLFPGRCFVSRSDH